MKNIKFADFTSAKCDQKQHAQKLNQHLQVLQKEIWWLIVFKVIDFSPLYDFKIQDSAGKEGESSISRTEYWRWNLGHAEERHVWGIKREYPFMSLLTKCVINTIQFKQDKILDQIL